MTDYNYVMDEYLNTGTMYYSDFHPDNHLFGRNPFEFTCLIEDMSTRRILSSIGIMIHNDDEYD